MNKINKWIKPLWILFSVASSTDSMLKILKYGVDGSIFAKYCKNLGITSIGQEYPETKNRGYVENASTSVQPIVVLKKDAKSIVYKIIILTKRLLKTKCKNTDPLKSRW